MLCESKATLPDRALLIVLLLTLLLKLMVYVYFVYLVELIECESGDLGSFITKKWY